MDLPVLTDRDVHDLKDFACRHAMDFVAASFVQSAADVRFIRAVLDEAGGFDIKIISKIENQEGLNNFAEILRETDGVMIARGACLRLPAGRTGYLAPVLFRRVERTTGPCISPQARMRVHAQMPVLKPV